MSRQKLMDRVYLTCIPSEKFKTSFLSAQIAAPLEKETAGCNALMVNVLSRGTVRCPDMASIGRELDLLYGARLEPTVRKKGENQLFGFVASCIDDRFLPKGEKLLEKLTDLLGEFFCMPVTRGGRLLEAYVESERENLADMIRNYASEENLADPFISPLFGEFEGFPSTYIQVGENEVLLDDSKLLYQKLLSANVSVKLDIFTGMWHVFQMSPFKTAYEAMDKNAEFIYDICR